MKVLTYTAVSPEVEILAALTVPTYPSDTLVLQFDPIYQHPKYMFFKISELAEKRPDIDVFQYIDCDIYMRGGNIFDRDLDCIWMLDEAAIRSDLNWSKQFQSRIVSQTGKEVTWSNHWWNPGVSLIPKKFAKYFVMPPWKVTDPEYLWVTRSSRGKAIVKNMPYINWIIAKYDLPVRDLTPLWNCLAPKTSRYTPSAHYWHITRNECATANEKVSTLRYLISKHGLASSYACLSTVVMGEPFEDLFKITSRYMERAAARWNMDFRVVRHNKKYPCPSFCKLDYPNGYDYYVFVDCDMFISPRCPSPLSIVPNGKFAAFNSLTLPWMESKTATWRGSLAKWSEVAGYEIPDPMPFYINGGMFVCSSLTRHILDVPPINLDHYFEQHGLNHNLWKTPNVYFPLDRKWNYGHLHIERDFKNASKDIYIAHLNGVSPRQRMNYLRKLEYYLQ